MDCIADCEDERDLGAQHPANNVRILPTRLLLLSSWPKINFLSSSCETNDDSLLSLCALPFIISLHHRQTPLVD